MKLDIESDSLLKPKLKRIVALFIIVFLLVLVVFTVTPKIPSIDANNLHFAKVQSGDLDIKISVYGHFQSEFERLISAPVAGQVSEIYIRAGTDVEKGTLIAKLSNPDLQQEHFTAKTKLEQMKADYKLAGYEKQNKELTFQAEIAELEHQIKKVELDVAVNQKLLAQGITAKLDLEKAQLDLALLKKKLTFSQYRFEKLKEMNKLALEQQSILLAQQEKLEHLIASKVDALSIRAGITGTLQKVDIKLGEQVSVGQSLAHIGSKRQLIARINIPQRAGENIKLGSELTINMQGRQLMAHITQVGSIIENGFIVAEAKLAKAAPDSVRPSQPLTGQLFLRSETDVLYVKQHPGFKPMTVNYLYKHLAPQQELAKTKIVFGELTGNMLLIEEGLEAGDRLATNDLSKWQEFEFLDIDSNSLF